MKKVYLSKSKAADPDKIICTKKVVGKLYPGCEFIEFKGGPYDPNIMGPADVVVVILPSEIHHESDDLMINGMGRGNYGESRYAIEEGKEVLFIVHKKEQDFYDYNNLGIVAFDKMEHEIEELSENNPHKNWQTSWAQLSFNSYTTINKMNKTSGSGKSIML